MSQSSNPVAVPAAAVPAAAALLSQSWAQQHEATLSSHVYSVAHWLSYIDAVDERIQEKQSTTKNATSRSQLDNAHDDNTTTTMQVGVVELHDLLMARDWVGRRAVSHLPRSYKLWKSTWEFLQSHQATATTRSTSSSSSSSSSTVAVTVWTVSASTMASCFERALRTLSAYPRVWMVYLQWLLQQLNQTTLEAKSMEPCLYNHAAAACNMFTHFRRTVNRALQSLPVAQHDKVWDGSGIIDALLALVPKTSTTVDDDDTKSLSLLDCLPWETAHCLLSRYAAWRRRLDPTGGYIVNSSSSSSSYFALDYAAWCERHGRCGIAAVIYHDLLNDLSTCTANNSSLESIQHDAWDAFTKLVAEHSTDVSDAGVDWQAILTSAIQSQLAKFEKTEAKNAKDDSAATTMLVPMIDSNGNKDTMLGLLYAWLASAWIQRGSFDMAAAVYEEGLRTVRTVRDFAVLYAAYLSLTEGLVTALSTSILKDDDGPENDMKDDDAVAEPAHDDNDWDLLVPNSEPRNGTNGTSTTTTGFKLAEMELAIARAEHLTARRPLLLNAVQLRQDVHNCAAWIERADLYVAANQARQAVAALEDGLNQIQQAKSTKAATSSSSSSSSGGVSLSQVVLRLVRVYTEDLNDVEAARDLLDRVCRRRVTATGFGQAADLAECWAAWIELELSHQAWDTALSLARQAVAGEPRQVAQQRSGGGGAQPAATSYRRLNLTRLLRLWDLLLDLEESLGTVQTTKDAYNRALEIKVATVQHVLNFGTFLTEQKFFEESFTAYERGIELFAFPHPGAKLLWKAYLTAFLQRYRGTKVERARNLFQRCLDDCPAEECAEFFMMNGEFEEEYGLMKRALSVYRNMCEKVTAAEKYTAYQLFIVKTIKYLGVPATREIYQDAIEKLTEPIPFVKMCTDFAKMEVGLEEMERARVIFAYGAQSADPRRIPEYWRDWNDFEVAHGSEDTFREMLRVKRSVEAAFSTVNYNATGMTENVKPLSNDEAMRMIASGEGMDLNEQGAVPTKSTVAGFVPQKRSAAMASLDDVEEKVAKLRQATGMGSLNQGATTNDRAVPVNSADNVDDDEIDLDDIDAEIEAAAAEGAATGTVVLNDVTTKAIPDAVFGGLAPAAQKAA
jgi:tetratricopeptide (TPR) repeat protein